MPATSSCLFIDSASGHRIITPMTEPLQQILACVKRVRDSGESQPEAITVLFAGPTGTGKTKAMQRLAHELAMGLLRIDLSRVVYKYIGETEKNLKRAFDEAEIEGAILVFDEADALFGKRSGVRDAHDRYANTEVSYLFQRLEAHHGLVIFTSNLKTNIDAAFLRRLRFIVDFPRPARPIAASATTLRG